MRDKSLIGALALLCSSACGPGPATLDGKSQAGAAQPTVHFRAKKQFIKKGESAPPLIFAGNAPSQQSMSSSDSTIVEVTALGRLAGKRVGTAIITSGLEKLQVGVVDIQGLSLSPTKITLQEGAQTPLVATTAGGIPVDNDALQWFSSSPAIADVSGPNLVAGHRPGPATVTAKYGSAESTVTVFVEPPKVQALSFKQGPEHVRVGEAAAYELAVKPSILSWSTSNPRVLAMQSPGTFRGKGAGMATVCALADAGRHTCVDVEVTK